jgi:NADPH-ferrihemoprotein reductase
LVQERHLEIVNLGSQIPNRFSAGLQDLLFLGFRHRTGDFLYEEEWPCFSKWLAVHTAFSRDDPERKIYVQDLIEEQGAHVCALLDAGARIYVCGRSHPMPTQVFDALAEVLHIHRGLSMEQAAAKLREMQRAQRYICDTWG